MEKIIRECEKLDYITLDYLINKLSILRDSKINVKNNYDAIDFDNNKVYSFPMINKKYNGYAGIRNIDDENTLTRGGQIRGKGQSNKYVGKLSKVDYPLHDPQCGGIWPDNMPPIGGFIARSDKYYS